MVETRHLNAIDALHKIAALTSAALFLNQGNEEEELAINKLIQLNAMEDCEIQILLDAQEDITTEIRSGLDNIIEGASHA